MGQEILVTLYLNEPVMNFQEEAMKDMAALKPGEQPEDAPDLTRGSLMSAMLMNGVKTDDAPTRAKLNRMAKKVHKALKNNAGKWEVDEERLKELKGLIEKLNPQSPYATPQYHGDIWNMFEDAIESLDAKKKKKETKP